MTKTPRANRKLILETYDRLQEVKATADKLGFHYNTVRKAVMLSQGRCQCGNRLEDKSYSQCKRCRTYRSNRIKALRAAKQNMKRCSGSAKCPRPLVPSRKDLCRYHLRLRRVVNRRYKERQKRRAAKDSTWLKGWEAIRQNILRRDGFACRACKRNDITLHVHHRDHDRSNNAKRNLITLCVTCHATLTRLLEHPNPKLLLRLLSK